MPKRIENLMGNPLVSRSADAAGVVLARLAGAVAAVRHTRALHPTGDLVAGELHIVGAYPRTGVAPLDQPGEYRVLVRTSRAVGLPEGMPDVLGIAIRWPNMGATSSEPRNRPGVDVDLTTRTAPPADLMFASTGTSTLTRYLLEPRRSLRSGALTTLLPMSGPRGPLSLALIPVDGPVPEDQYFDLRYSSTTGPWKSLGSLSIETQPVTDQDEGIRFDTIAHPLFGLPHYEWVQRLRAPAYRDSRQASSPVKPAIPA